MKSKGSPVVPQKRRPYWHIERNPNPPAVTQVSEYDGAPDPAIVCTQLPATSSKTDQQRIVRAWCEFFARPASVRRVWFLSRLPQEIFEAVCTQRALQGLYVKWSGITDLSPIAGLVGLTHLYLGASGSVTDLSPVADLEALTDLSIDNFQKVTDYSPLGRLRSLRHLMISGDAFAPKKIKIASLAPFASLAELQTFSRWAATIVDGSYDAIVGLKNLEHLDLPKTRDTKAIEALVASLPGLRSGNVLG